MQVRVVEYNILDGVHSNDEKPVLDSERVGLLGKVVRELNPDILVLTEVCDSSANDHGVFIDFKELFGLPHYYHAAAVSGRRHGNSILSRWPIVESENYSVHHRKFGRVKLDIEGKPVTVDMVHPHPSLSEEERVQFFKGVIRDAEGPYILAGDFNAWNKECVAQYDRDKLIDKFRQISHDWDPNAKFDPSWVISNMTARSVEFVRERFTDVYETIHGNNPRYTVPTDFLSKDKSGALRLDYIFCSKDIKVVDAGVIQNELTNKASDHHPIYAVLELD